MAKPALISAEYDTPFGSLAVIVTRDDMVVRSSGFLPLRDVASRLPRAYVGSPVEPGRQPQVAAAVAAWLDGDGSALTQVPVQQDGGEFTQAVWHAMRTVPSGSVISYGELAESAGRPRAARAVGTACARNNIAPFVPCHRVVRAGGELGNYGFGGVAVKAGMLDLEGRSAAERDVSDLSAVSAA